MPGFDHFQKELAHVIFQKMKAPGETVSYSKTFSLLNLTSAAGFPWV